MKKLIAMIGIGAVLCVAPSCKKSDVKPMEVTDSIDMQQRDIRLGDMPADETNTSMYVMLSSKACLTRSEYSALVVDIRDVRVFSEQNGWQSLKPVANDWDLVRMQNLGHGLNITDRAMVKPGTISKVAITFGENNKVALNNGTTNCLQLAAREVVLDLKGEVMAGEVNELKLAVDICGNVFLQPNGDRSQCHMLRPMVEFQGISQKMVK